jgi:hypothetical protein
MKDRDRFTGVAFKVILLFQGILGIDAILELTGRGFIWSYLFKNI